MSDKVCSSCSKSFSNYFTERDMCWYCINTIRMCDYEKTGIITTDIVGLLNFCKLTGDKDTSKYFDEIGVGKLNEVFKQIFQEIECSLRHIEFMLEQFAVKHARELKLLLRDENKFLLKRVYKCVIVNVRYRTTYLDNTLILHVDLINSSDKEVYLTITVCEENSELLVDMLYIQATKDDAVKIINIMMEEDFAIPNH